MGIEINCDRCSRDMEHDDLLCRKCAARPEVQGGDSDVSDHIEDLAAAIRRGDLTEASDLLDKVAAAVPGWSDRVSIGRYGPRGRVASLAKAA